MPTARYLRRWRSGDGQTLGILLVLPFLPQFQSRGNLAQPLSTSVERQ